MNIQPLFDADRATTPRGRVDRSTTTIGELQPLAAFWKAIRPAEFPVKDVEMPFMPWTPNQLKDYLEKI